MSLRATPTRRPYGRGLGLAFAIAAFPVLATAQRAQAASGTAAPPSEAGSVVVWPPLCKVDKFPLAAFLDCLRVELAGRGLDCCTLADPDGPTPPIAAVQVHIQIDPCTADADRLQVDAREAASARMSERQVSLSDVPDTARPRALALAVAELIRSLGQGPPDKAPEAIPIPAQGLVASPPPIGTRPTQLSIHVESEVRSLPTRDTTLWGGRARLTAHRRLFHSDLDLGGNYARAHAQLGDVLFHAASVGLGFGPRFANGTAVLDLGLHAELGWAWIHGETAFADVRAGAGSGPICSVGLRASLEVPAQMKVRPNLTLEGGAVVRGVKGEVGGESVAGMTGYYLLAALGIAVSL
jgi:hypothetical protein